MSRYENFKSGVNLMLFTECSRAKDKKGVIGFISPNHKTIKQGDEIYKKTGEDNKTKIAHYAVYVVDEIIKTQQSSQPKHTYYYAKASFKRVSEATHYQSL